MKQCTACKKIKHLDEFYNSRVYPDGKGYRCKSCDGIARRDYENRHRERRRQNLRKANRKHKYGLTEDDFQRMLSEQDHKCAICNHDIREPGHTNHQRDTLCIDHCHTTGRVRGLLCHHCNRALGLFKDNIESLQKAISYLKGSK